METRAQAKRKMLETEKKLDFGLVDPLASADNAINGQSHHINSVFGNNLIFGVIGDYLGVSDLKCLRQTCSLLLDKVNGHRKFFSSLRVIIKDETIKQGILKATAVWKAARIPVSEITFHQILGLPASIQDLELEYSTAFKTRSSCRAACKKLLASPVVRNLESLTIDMNLLELNLSIPALASIGRVVGTVRNLRLTGYMTIDCQVESKFERYLNSIGGLGWSLKSIAVFEDLDSDGKFSPVVATTTAKAFAAILASSAGTVQTIKLGKLDVGTVTEIQETLCQPFPRLKNIKLSIKPSSADAIAVAHFFNLHPRLESIELVLAGGISSDTFSTILDAVKNSFNLRLHTLRLRGGSTFLAQYFAEMNSRAFQELQRLKIFEIHCDSFLKASSESCITAIMNNLPATVRCLDISALRWCSRANKVSVHLRDLTGLPFLSEFKIGDKIIDDAGLQFICRTLTGLRVLQFGAAEITYFGLTGEDGRDKPNSGASLRDLHGLCKLVLFSCHKATPVGLIKAIQFLELRVVDFYDTCIPEDVLLQIVSNNPSLESVAFSSMSKLPNYRSIHAVAPRLKEIKTRMWTGIDQVWYPGI